MDSAQIRRKPSGLAAFAQSSGYLVIPIGVRSYFKASPKTALVGLVTLLLCLTVFAASCVYYALDTSQVVSPENRAGQGLKGCQPILLPQNSLRPWDSSSRWEGDPKFSKARHLWTLELNDYNNDEAATKKALAELQARAHDLLDRLSKPQELLDNQYHRKVQRMLFEDLIVNGTTGYARLKPSINAASFVEGLALDPYDGQYPSDSEWNAGAVGGIQMINTAPAPKPCNEYKTFAKLKKRGSTLVSAVMERMDYATAAAAQTAPTYKFTATCGSAEGNREVKIKTSEHCYLMRTFEPFRGLYEIMETLPQSGDLQDGQSMEEHHKTSLGYPAFREGLQWEATQVLLLDYCNNANTSACAFDRLTAAQVTAAAADKGSPEVYPTVYDASLQKAGYLIQQKRGVLVWDGEKAPLPRNLTEAQPPDSGEACYSAPKTLVYYTFLVVPTFSTPPVDDKPLDLNTICKPRGSGGALNIRLDLDYYIHSKNGTQLPKPEYLFTGRYNLYATEKLANPMVPPTGMLRCNMSVWYFKNAGNASPSAIAIENVTLPSAVDNRVYKCTLYNSPYKVLSLSFPPSSIAYMILGSVLLVFASAKVAKESVQEGGKERGATDVGYDHFVQDQNRREADCII